MDKPKGFENDVSEYGPVSFDSYSGEPVKWGHTIHSRLGDDRFNELRSLFQLEVTNRDPWNTEWSVIRKTLSLTEAIEKYGPVTQLLVGPRGGSRTIQFTKTIKEVNPRYKYSDNKIKFFSTNIEGDFSTIPKDLVAIDK